MPVEQTQRNPAMMGNKTSQSSGAWKLKMRGRILAAEHPGAVWKESQLLLRYEDAGVESGEGFV